jgi:hypothetical protein
MQFNFCNRNFSLYSSVLSFLLLAQKKGAKKKAGEIDAVTELR